MSISDSLQTCVSEQTAKRKTSIKLQGKISSTYSKNHHEHNIAIEQLQVSKPTTKPDYYPNEAQSHTTT